MLIKSVRIRTSSGAAALTHHLMNGEDNEAVSMVRGAIGDLGDAVADARQHGRTYALRHIILSPQLEIDQVQFEQALARLAGEFGFCIDAVVTVEHTKPRSVPGVARKHWHIVVGEVTAVSGQVLSNRHDHARHEKISRLLELEFGHPIIAGAHDMAVLASLRRDGLGDAADRLAAHLGQGARPSEAFTTAAHQQAKRSGLDLAVIKQHVRTAAAEATGGSDFRDRLSRHGLSIAAGDKADTWIIGGLNGIFLGSGPRLSGLSKGAFNKLMETTQHDHNHPDRTGGILPADRPDDPHRHPDNPEGHGYNSVTGPSDGIADARGAGFVPGNCHRPVADDRDGHRAEPGQPGSTAPTPQRADHRHDTAAHGRGLIEAFGTAVKSLSALTRSELGQTYASRTSDHLSSLEAEAHARIAAAKALAGPQPSKKLAASRMYFEAVAARHDALWRSYRALEQQMATPPPTPGFLARLLRKPVSVQNNAALERQHARLRSELIVSERSLTGALAGVSQAEKADAVARADHLGAVQAELRLAHDALGDIFRARRIVSVFPRFIFTGLPFITSTAQRIERRRRDGWRNPQAVNIWGLPLDF
jgi:hypothetical protein